MNKAEQLHEKVIEALKTYEIDKAWGWTRKIDPDSAFYREITNEGNQCLFYKWLACLVRVTQPKRVVELGADRGGSTVFILSELPEKGFLYSCDIREGWDYTPSWDGRLIKVLGNDLVAFDRLNNHWKDVDLWFVDSDHDSEHVRKEMEQISKLAKPGAVIINHDVYMFNLLPVLREYPYDLWEDNRKVFGNGIALQVV